MMIIAESCPLAVWKTASNYLLQHRGEDYNLLLTFPCAGAADEAPLKQCSPRSVLGDRFDNARDVANTIFPARTWSKVNSRDELYGRYRRAHAKSSNRRWGTYFGRMIAFGQSEVNQLERVINALLKWPNSYRAALFIHTSSAETDKLRPLGGPCLQYLQFNCPNSKMVDMLAVYRNHDYCNKVLGNLYGLSRLLNFICDQSNRTAGAVSCLSAHAYFNASRRDQIRLIGAL